MTTSNNAVFLIVSIAIALTVHGNESRPDICSAGGGTAQYDLPLHIASIFIIMAVSASGILGTLYLGTRSAHSMRIATFLQLMKMFGIGVIIGTAWSHLLPDAFAQFGSVCLEGTFWERFGVNWVGVFAMLSGFIVQMIELVAFSYSKKHSHNRPVIQGGDDDEECDELKMQHAIPASHGHSVHLEAHFHDEGQSLSTVVLEAGILFHSLVIGVTLGVATTDFKTLLLAVSFHQLFEGMALGSLISNLKRNRSCLALLMLGLIYPLTTPIGITIGIAVRGSYDPNSVSIIVAQGILGSLSAGILFYNAYAELISVEINHNRGFRLLSNRLKVLSMLAMYCGVAAMTVLALWS